MSYSSYTFCSHCESCCNQEQIHFLWMHWHRSDVKLIWIINNDAVYKRNSSTEWINVWHNFDSIFNNTSSFVIVKMAVFDILKIQLKWNGNAFFRLHQSFLKGETPLRHSLQTSKNMLVSIFSCSSRRVSELIAFA